MFGILVLTTQTDGNRNECFMKNSDGSYKTFDTGKQAAEYATDLNEIVRRANSDIRYKVKRMRVVKSNEWRERERKRLQDGTYKPVPWAEEPWFMQSPYGDLHFPHVSVDNPAKIAFTPDEIMGCEDRQIRIRPGRYLRRYFPHLSEEIRQDLIEKYRVENISTEVKFAWTPDEIEEVYKEGPDSCMAGDSDRFHSEIHPVRVYGAGDLAVAYIENECEDNDRVVARTVCWPANKVYVRCFGDEERLASALDKLGYVKDNIEGARLLLVQEDEGIVCPYLDSPTNTVDVIEDRLVVTANGSLLAQGQHGYAVQPINCDECGESVYDENDLAYVASLEQNRCLDCMDEIERCNDCEELFLESEMLEANDTDAFGRGMRERLYCGRCAELYTSVCEGCNERFVDEHIEDDLCESCREDKEEEESDEEEAA